MAFGQWIFAPMPTWIVFKARELRSVRGKSTVNGSAVIPFRPDVPGKVDLQFQSLGLAGLSGEFPQWPIKVEGSASGTVQVVMPKADPGLGRQIDAKVDLQSAQLRLQSIPAERVSGEFRYREAEVEYRLQGETLGGKFELNGKVPSAPPAEPAQEGRLQIRRARLGRLCRALGLAIGRDRARLDRSRCEVPSRRFKLDADRQRLGDSNGPSLGAKPRLVEEIEADIVLNGRGSAFEI